MRTGLLPIAAIEMYAAKVVRRPAPAVMSLGFEAVLPCETINRFNIIVIDLYVSPINRGGAASLLLNGADGTKFELNLRGWGPNNPNPNRHREVDWLDVAFRARTSSGEWGYEGELLTAEDVTALASWLEDVATQQHHEPVMWFLEPHFRFTVQRETDHIVTLRVYLEYRVRPPWASPTDGPDFWIDLHLSRNDLSEAVTSLRSELAEVKAR